MIGVSNNAPLDPVLVSVNVPPPNSSGVILFSLVRAATSAIFLAMPPIFKSPASLTTGTNKPRSVSTATPRCSAAW